MPHYLRGYRRNRFVMNLEKFTDRAKGFLQAAQTLAIRLNHQRISPEHLLKALLEDEEGMASGLIQRAGGNPPLTTQEIDKALAKMDAFCDAMGKRMDAFEEGEKKRADAEAKAKADAEEESRKKGDPEQLKADKAKKDAEEDEKKKAELAKAKADKFLKKMAS